MSRIDLIMVKDTSLQRIGSSVRIQLMSVPIPQVCQGRQFLDRMSEKILCFLVLSVVLKRQEMLGRLETPYMLNKGKEVDKR